MGPQILSLEKVKIKKGWDQEEDQRNITINLIEINTRGVHCTLQ